MRLLLLLALVSLTAATSVKGCRDPKGMEKYMVLANELSAKYMISCSYKQISMECLGFFFSETYFCFRNSFTFHKKKNITNV